MSTRPRLVLCGGTERDPGTEPKRHPIRLQTFGPNRNVHVKFEDVARVFGEHLSPRLTDLLELAAYAYSADTATDRGEGWSKGAEDENWRRDFHFVVPVRDVDFWSDQEIVALLSASLGFLADCKFTFEFEPLKKDFERQEYISFTKDNDWPFYDAERVVMFSGGLDSLAGAVEVASRGEKLVLVSHRPAIMIDKRLSALVAKLKHTVTVHGLAICPALPYTVAHEMA